MKRSCAAALLATMACIPPTVTAPVPAPHTPASVRTAIDSLIAQPEFRNAHWGVLIVDPVWVDTIYSHNAGKLFMPASNMKIITGAVALARLGPEYRFLTQIATRGEVVDSVLHGDLLVIGHGDPTVSDHMREDAMLPLLEIADSLAARGIERITGQVVAAGDAFPDAVHGYGWAWDDFDYPYSAGVDELLFNEGFSEIVVRAGHSGGEPATATASPESIFPNLRVTATTAEPNAVDSVAGDGVMPHTELDLSRDADSGEIVVGGTILAGDSATLRLTHVDPVAAYLVALGDALAARGIAVNGDSNSVPAGMDTAQGPASGVPSSLDTLFAMHSPPLSEILRALEKPSQNQIAEVLLKTLGLEVAGVGSADSGRAVVERQLLAWGADPESFAVRDGSGLSRHNYVTPATLVLVLDAMRRHPDFGIFYDALPIAGVDGTIARRMRDTPAAGNVRAKTGFIDKARSLSGYVTTADGELLLFSILANNWTVPVRRVEEVQDVIAARLAAMRLARGR